MTERIKVKPTEVTDKFHTVLKDKCTTDRSATVLTQAGLQFGGENVAINRFREIIEPFRSRWWPDALSEYQPGASLTYASLAFDKSPAEAIEEYNNAAKLTGTADSAGDLVALSFAHGVEVSTACNLAIDIYKNSNRPPYNGMISGDSEAVMMASAELMVGRQVAVDVLQKIDHLKKWDKWDSEPQLMLVQAVIARGGDLDQNIVQLNKIIEVVDTKEFHKKLGSSSDLSTALVSLSCFLGDMTPDEFLVSQGEIVSAGHNPDIATRLAHVKAMAENDVLSVFSITSDIVAGKTYFEDRTFLYLGKKSKK